MDLEIYGKYLAYVFLFFVFSSPDTGPYKEFKMVFCFLFQVLLAVRWAAWACWRADTSPAPSRPSLSGSSEVKSTENISPFHRIRIGSGFNHFSGSGSRSAKMAHKNRKKLRSFMFWCAWCSLLRIEGFFCSLDFIYGGLGIGKLQFLIKSYLIFIFSCKFFPIFWSLKPWMIRIGRYSASNAGSGSG